MDKDFIHYNKKMEMVRFPGGYATPLARNVTFHYYTQDYLGSNRAVVNGTTGAVERQGKPPGPLKGEEVVRRIRFGGKELVTANGLILSQKVFLS